MAKYNFTNVGQTALQGFQGGMQTGMDMYQQMLQRKLAQQQMVAQRQQQMADMAAQQSFEQQMFKQKAEAEKEAQKELLKQQQSWEREKQKEQVIFSIYESGRGGTTKDGLQTIPESTMPEYLAAKSYIQKKYGLGGAPPTDKQPVAAPASTVKPETALQKTQGGVKTPLAGLTEERNSILKQLQTMNTPLATSASPLTQLAPKEIPGQRQKLVQRLTLIEKTLANKKLQAQPQFKYPSWLQEDIAFMKSQDATPEDIKKHITNSGF